MIVSGAFEEIRLAPMKQLEVASLEGPVELDLWSDEQILGETGVPAKFPYEERRYIWESCRYVDRISESSPCRDVRAREGEGWVGVGRPSPVNSPQPTTNNPRKVIVTGCFDWLHSGHVRFFEEAASYGELTVVVGSDRNVSLLKGPHHPMFPEEERRYLVQAFRPVHQALISSGTGWMDAAPEIDRLRPDIYVVNEDGDKPEKAEFCLAHGIEYRVLKRTPAEGLPRRMSTELRGF